MAEKGDRGQSRAVEISASREKISTFFERQEQKTYDAQIALTGVAGQLMHGDEQHQVPLV